MLNTGMKTQGLIVSPQANVGSDSRNPPVSQAEEFPLRIGLLTSESPDSTAAWMGSGRSRHGVYGRPQLAGDQSARRVILPDIYQRWSQWMQNDSDSHTGSGVFDNKILADFQNCPSYQGLVQATIDRRNRQQERSTFMPRVLRSSFRPTPFDVLFTAKMRKRGEDVNFRNVLEADLEEAERSRRISTNLPHLPGESPIDSEGTSLNVSRKTSFRDQEESLQVELGHSGTSSRKSSVRSKKKSSQVSKKAEPAADACVCDSIIVKPEWMQMDKSRPLCPGPPPPPVPQPPPETVQVADSVPIKVLEFEQTPEEMPKPLPPPPPPPPEPVMEAIPEQQPAPPSSGETSELQPTPVPDETSEPKPAEPVISGNASEPPPAEQITSEQQAAPIGDGTAERQPEATTPVSSDQASELKPASLSEDAAGTESRPVPDAEAPPTPALDETPEAQPQPPPIHDETSMPEPIPIGDAPDPLPAPITGEEASVPEPTSVTGQASEPAEPTAVIGQTSEPPVTASSDETPEPQLAPVAGETSELQPSGESSEPQP